MERWMALFPPHLIAEWRRGRVVRHNGRQRQAEDFKQPVLKHVWLNFKQLNYLNELNLLVTVCFQCDNFDLTVQKNSKYMLT